MPSLLEICRSLSKELETMQFFQKLALRVAGVFESEDSKQDELRTALNKANVKAVETALIKGAVPIRFS